MAREEVGSFFRHQREAAMFSHRPHTLSSSSSSPLSSSNLHADKVSRMIRLSLPIKLRHCFSIQHQRLLFQLIELCKGDSEAYSKVIPNLILFIQQIDYRDVLWISCCETGFAFNLLKETIDVSSFDDKYTLAEILVHRMHEMADIFANSKDANSIANATLVVQEILNALAACHDFPWLLHQEKIALVIKNVIW